MGAAARWFAHEFLYIAPAASASSFVVSVARIGGAFALVHVVRIGLSRGIAGGGVLEFIQLGFVGLLAILVGNVVRESIVEAGAGILRLCHRHFVRTGVRLDGGAFEELRYPDGRWLTTETRRDGTLREWTDRQGAIHRVVIRPRGPLGGGQE